MGTQLKPICSVTGKQCTCNTGKKCIASKSLRLIPDDDLLVLHYVEREEYEHVDEEDREHLAKPERANKYDLRTVCGLLVKEIGEYPDKNVYTLWYNLMTDPIARGVERWCLECGKSEEIVFIELARLKE